MVNASRDMGKEWCPGQNSFVLGEKKFIFGNFSNRFPSSFSINATVLTIKQYLRIFCKMTSCFSVVIGC